MGMIIGVPTFAVIYRLLSDGVKASLRRKQLPEDTAAYEGVNCINEESRKLVQSRPDEPTGKDMPQTKQGKGKKNE